jgi:subtilisin family serine protease
MKRIYLLLIIIVFTVNLISYEKLEKSEQSFKQNEIIVKTASFENGYNCTKKKAFSTPIIMCVNYSKYISCIKKIKGTSLLRLVVHNNVSCKDLINILKKDPNIKDVSLNYIASITEDVLLRQRQPNDPTFYFQYGLQNTGKLFNPENKDNAKPDSDIGALFGWYWSIGSPDVVIAVCDTGVATDHEDLKNKIISGYNFISDNNDTYDDHGHGTFVASIAAAETNNGIGMSGVSWNSMIIPIKVMNNNGKGSYLQIAAGIRYAADNGAKVINLSVGGENPSFILEDACKYAFEKGCIIVAASGNTASAVLYPAAYDKYCIAVGASDYNDEIACFSNFGESIDVVAPGVAVFGAVYNPETPEKLSNYGWDTGTSFAAPFVSGAVALLLSYKPFLSTDMAMNLLKITADDVNSDTYPGVDIYMGYGRINLRTLLSPYILKQ